jgi:N-formylglutamate amidohydrolase
MRTTLAALLLAFAAHAAASDLVVARPGGLPILLTAPHGGLAPVPGVPPRKSGTTSTDGYTIELTEAVARHVEKALGKAPYVVAARFSRKYIDANRADHEAFEVPAARPAYDAYHGAIKRYVAELRERYPGGAVLVDVHGQSTEPEAVHRGTRDGATVAALVRRRGAEAVTGPQSLFGTLQARGYAVLPAGRSLIETREDPRYRGGHTVHTYGSSVGGGIDAIQVEVGAKLRRDPAFAAALADGIVALHNAHLAAARAP